MNLRLQRRLPKAFVAAALAATSATALLSGCATMKPPDVQYGGQCRASYSQIDARVDAAGVRDAGYSRVPDFPYLRGDRFATAFRDQLANRDVFWEWLSNLRLNDVDSRSAEMTNLGFAPDERFRQLLDLRTCAAWLSDFEMDDLAWRKHLVEMAVPADEYSGSARVSHFYPLAVGSLRERLRKEHEAVAQTFAKPVDQLDAPGPLVLWQPAPDAELDRPPPDVDKGARDHLDRIGLLLSDWGVLARIHAPRLWIETAADYDRPGMPIPGKVAPQLDTSAPTLYYVVTYTRFGGQSLIQLVYFTWFSEHKAASPDDPSTGPFDGFLWRVTLDRHGQAIAYDSASASGLHHAWFPARPLKLKPIGEDDEAPFLPQAQPVPAGPLAVRLQSGTHAIRRVIAVSDAKAAQTQGYRLAPYEDLLTLRAQAGGTRSLFGTDGIVPGSGGASSWSLDATGIKSPGAMRQWGHHPIALIGRHHLDDVDVLSRVFEAPEDVVASAPPPEAMPPELQGNDIPQMPVIPPPNDQETTPEPDPDQTYVPAPDQPPTPDPEPAPPPAPAGKLPKI